MTQSPLGTYLLEFLMNVIFLAGIPLAVATVCGLTISIFQAITQIQDQTLSQTVKIVAIVAVLLGFGASLVAPLIQSTHQVFDNFGVIVR